MSSLEDMFCDSELRQQFEKGTPEFEKILFQLKQQFRIVDDAIWGTVTNPQYNSIYQDNVVSVVFRHLPVYLTDLKPAITGRKYFLNKGWVYDKVYFFVFPNTNTLPCPEGTTPYATGQLFNVLGQPGDEDLTRYVCLYFMHKDHAAVEAWSNQQLPQGKYSTFYGATFDTKENNKLLRMKTYCYDDQGIYADWDVYFMQHCKKHGVFDALL